MLIIYPTDLYDSFVSLADAETILTNNVPSSQLTDWNNLLDSDKEIYLRQSTILIANKIALPTTLEENLKRATAYLALHSVGKIMTSNDGKTGNIKRKRVEGVIDMEYFNASQDSNSFPEIVTLLLKDFGTTSSSSFAFSRA